MNKKILFLSVAACTAVASVSTILFARNTPAVFTNAEGTCAVCSGNHYTKVDPTYTTSGYRAYWVCCKCGNVTFSKPSTGGTWTDQSAGLMIGGAPTEGHAAYLPPLNEEDYTKTFKVDKSYDEVWTLKGTTYTVTKTIHKSGYITICDYSSGKEIDTTYLPDEFNSTFEGINFSYNSSTKTSTFNITKDGGYTFNNCCLTFPSYEVNKIIITGNPLTINAPEGCNDDALSFYDGNTSTTVCTSIIDTDISIVYSSAYTKPSAKCGIKESILTINEGKTVNISGFKNGITASYTSSKAKDPEETTINGTLNISSTDLAIVSSNSSKNRRIKIADNLDLFYDDGVSATLIQTGGTTDTNTIKSASATKISILPHVE